MGRLNYIFSKLPTTSEFLMHRFFPEHASMLQLQGAWGELCLHVPVISRWSKPALHQQGLLLAGANWQFIPVSIQWLVKMKSAVTSHRVRWSSCCSWQWNRWVPAVPMTSYRSGKSVSTQLSLKLSVPSPPQWPYSSPPHGRTSPDLIWSLTLWTHKK